MAQRQRGQAVIIVNKNFPVNKKNEPRKGATKDIKKMFKLFTLLDFRVKPYWDLKGKDMIEVINKACEDKTNEDCECFVLVISSHGEEEVNAKSRPGDVVHEHVVLGTDHGVVLVEDILKKMENTTLKGKPKLCFLQACRHSTHYLKTEEDRVDTGINVGVSGIMEGGSAEGGSGDADGGKDAEDIVDSLIQGAIKENMTGEITEGGMIGMIDLLSLKDSDDEGGDEEEMDIGHGQDTGPPTLPPPQDVVPSFCPRDCLVMYPVQPHKYAYRSFANGSWMLHFLYQNKELLLTESGSLVQYLTKVTADLAARDYSYSRAVSNGGEIMTEKMEGLQMAATIVHRLTADVRFHPFEKSVMSRWMQGIKTKASFFVKNNILLK